MWVDEVPLSRLKRNIARDFADGVLTAEIVHHYFPRIVEVHNYPSANSYAQKMYNWQTLNARVFKKIGWQLRQEELDAICSCQMQAVERMLKQLQVRLSKYGSRSKEEEAAPQRPHAQATPRSAAAPPRRVGGLAGGAQVGLRDGAVQELLAEKDQNISELRETVEILEIKIQDAGAGAAGETEGLEDRDAAGEATEVRAVMLMVSLQVLQGKGQGRRARRARRRQAQALVWNYRCVWL